MRIAYLGPTGTYSEEAALHFESSGAARYIPYATISEVIQAAENSKVDGAVVPIENSTEGSVSQTVDALKVTSLQIAGEFYLPIRHQLISKAAKLEDVIHVMAYPQALAQCRHWLETYTPHAAQHATTSNARAAVLARKDANVAAIASARAASLYGLDILAPDIEDNPGNMTRFLLLSRKGAPITGNDKTSFICSVADTSGSLYELLGILAKHSVNMSKIESRPAHDTPWQYLFYIDIAGHRTEDPVKHCLKEVAEQAATFKLLGSYPRAKDL